MKLLTMMFWPRYDILCVWINCICPELCFTAEYYLMMYGMCTCCYLHQHFSAEVCWIQNQSVVHLENLMYSVWKFFVLFYKIIIVSISKMISIIRMYMYMRFVSIVILTLQPILKLPPLCNVKHLGLSYPIILQIVWVVPSILSFIIQVTWP